MKSTIWPKETIQKERPFPKLMKYTDLVILATSRGIDGITGTIVYSGSVYTRLGYHDTTWSNHFKDFLGSITLLEE